MPVCFSGLMCHAPIVIPQVAGHRGNLCATSTRTMREVATRVVDSNPERLVLISPHSPRLNDRFCSWKGAHLGDLSAFGFPQLSIDLPDAPEVAQSLSIPANLESTKGNKLDHGAVVPLFFLVEAGWCGPTSILSVPWNGNQHEEIGRLLNMLPGKTAVIASGDMSHRLKKGAPAGYHPQAQNFDKAFVAALQANNWSKIAQIPFQKEAAEDVVDSTRVAVAAAQRPLNAEVLSYEGPWGVGYTQAVFYDPAPPLYAIARRAVRSKVIGEEIVVPQGGPAAKGVFVTLNKAGKLRGCIGHIFPTCHTLYQEITEVAQLSATKDPRFPVVKVAELPSLQYEISVLEPPEEISNKSQLNPKKYGVIVSSGYKKGVLLPSLDGIDTIDMQLKIACRKAGIDQQTPMQVERFTVTKVKQPL